MTTEYKPAAGPFLAFTRICLNNWHYISKKTLTLNEEINFFTGHSGSGKSTVIDALQLVLYANTDGRGFFNKAAADDSDRSLIEYLRGMVNIGDNNEFSYLRNRNFSSTIVLELKRTDTGEYQCIGIVFDVETSSNEISRRFFWHKGPLWENEYRTDTRTMSIREVESRLNTCYGKEEHFSTSHNERFRRILYETYLGGLDSEKFPLLFKRAIPFRMNIKLEDFVKEYICTEQDIHMEDMQESVMQYGRMRRKIEDTSREIGRLREIRKAFDDFTMLEDKLDKYQWFVKKLELLDTRSRIQNLNDRTALGKEELERRTEALKDTERRIKELTGQSDELLRRIASTGYGELKEQLASLGELCEQLSRSEARWQKTALALKKWEEEDITSNQTLWDIEEFEQRTVTRESLTRLKRSLASMEADTEKLRQETVARSNELKRREKQLKEELEKLRAGSKAYPKYLEEAKEYLQRRLFEETGKNVDVSVLADLLEVKHPEWANAIEGYLGNNKLSLVVSPGYAKAALKIYGELDAKKYYSVAVLDTEKAASCQAAVLKNSLAEEAGVKEAFLTPYVELLLGKVIKCHSVEELSDCKIGITPECLLYHNLRLQYINPEQYTRMAYIGKDSLRKRIRLTQEELDETEKARQPLEQVLADCKRISGLETLKGPAEEYMQWLEEIESWKKKKAEKKQLSRRLEELKARDIGQLEGERLAILAQCEEMKGERDRLRELVLGCKNELERFAHSITELEEAAADQNRRLKEHTDHDRELSSYLADRKSVRYDRERDAYENKCRILTEQSSKARETLMNLRTEYVRSYPGRNVPVSAMDNAAYDRLLDRLSCDDLERFKEQAARQARSAVEHFKDDFMYKIRSAIKEAMLRTEELNRIISRLDFGKDKYQFVVSRCKGADGRYYDMFMDESLEVDPSQLDHSFENQLNLFAMEHENHYGERINELINIFIPPENAAPEQLDEARRNMEKYSDYRTYLSFDMQQLVQNGDEVIKIRLSRMLRKNSGGEGQNPLYVALLASFAQAYHIGQPLRLRRSPSIRLVILDEAFSKMDAEKVAS